MLDKQYIKKYIKDKLTPLQLNKVILFGSYVYGNPTDQSDIDLCIVYDKIESKLSLKRKIRKLLDDIDMPMDIIAVDTQYYLSHSDENWLNTALYDARHKGEVLYAKK
jgi:predicted nucleotidyltransferase